MSTLSTTPSSDLPTAAAPRRGAPAAVLRWLEPRGQALLLLGLRLVHGWLLAQTGWGKLGHLARTTGFFADLHLPAPALLAALVGGVELLGGVALAVGAGARLAAGAVAAVMVTALLTAHGGAIHGLGELLEQPPFPFLLATLVVLAFGAGRLSVDGWLRARRRRGESR